VDETDVVNVLSTMGFSEEWLDRVRALSPRLRVAQYTAPSVDEVPDDVWRDADVLYTGSAFPDPVKAPRLRWVQLDTSGVDHVRNSPVWQAPVDITTLNGVAPSNMAEFAVMMMLAFGHHLKRMVELQQQRYWPTFQERWDWFMPSELRGATVGIIGYGSIGRQIGQIAHAFGMRVLALRRSGGSGKADRQTYRIPDLATATEREPERIYGPAELGEMLPECDYVVLMVPYTADSHHMINERALRAMKPSAVLINLARGGVVEEGALIRALQEGWIAGAALDVFEQEPLPADSPLWSMRNVMISPHVAGFTPHYHERVMGIFVENLTRFLEGQPLLNRADRDAGY
jgi:phosphoglycerate dehydrogenase-like enzyme